MKTIVLTTVALLGGISIASAQEAESPHSFSGTVALTTDYLFRGISQTDRHPAVQGSLDYSYTPWGLYLGAWASNVDDTTSDGTIEIDWYGGARGEFADTGIGWDVGAIYYHYPGNDDTRPDADYVEAKAGLSYTFSNVPLEPATAFTFYWTPDNFGETGNGFYYDGSLGLSLPYEFGLGFHVAYGTIEDINPINDEYEDYIDWKIGLSREVYGFNLNVSYSDTADEDDVCLGSSNCDGTVLFTVSRSL